MAGQMVKRGKRSWQVKIFMGRDSNRKQKFHRKTIHGTKKDAQRYLNGVLRQMDLGIFVEPTTISLEDYVKRWLRDAARPRVSSRTADGYKALLDRYIVPPLGHQRLDRIQPLDIQEVYGQMQVSGLSARVVRHTHAALHNALKQAVKWELLSRNPSDFVELPKVPHKEYRVLSPEEAARFFRVAATKTHGLILSWRCGRGCDRKNTLPCSGRILIFQRVRHEFAARSCVTRRRFSLRNRRQREVGALSICHSL